MPGLTAREGTIAMRKQDVLDIIRTMPEEFDPEELMYHLFVLAKIEHSERSIAEHGLIPDEELERELDTCRE